MVEVRNVSSSDKTPNGKLTSCIVHSLRRSSYREMWSLMKKTVSTGLKKKYTCLYK